MFPLSVSAETLAMHAGYADFDFALVVSKSNSFYTSCIVRSSRQVSKTIKVKI